MDKKKSQDQNFTSSWHLHSVKIREIFNGKRPTENINVLEMLEMLGCILSSIVHLKSK